MKIFLFLKFYCNNNITSVQYKVIKSLHILSGVGSKNKIGEKYVLSSFEMLIRKP